MGLRSKSMRRHPPPKKKKKNNNNNKRSLLQNQWVLDPNEDRDHTVKKERYSPQIGGDMISRYNIVLPKMVTTGRPAPLPSHSDTTVFFFLQNIQYQKNFCDNYEKFSYSPKKFSCSYLRS